MIWRRTHHRLDDNLRVDVALPEGYDDTDADYPLLVCLDAQWTFGTVCDSALNLGLARLVPRVVVAGVGWDGLGTRDVLRRRGHAFTPTDAPFPERVAPRNGGPTPSGGGPRFLGTLRDEVLPLLEDTYRVRPAERTLIGHSLSALFGLYVLCHEPALFSRLLLASPSIWWDDRVILDIEASTAPTRPDVDALVFLSVGSEEEQTGFPMITNARLMAERLRTRGYPGLHLELAVIDGELHHSTIPAAISRGLRRLFPPVL